jgi:Zn-dependent protease
MQEEFPSIELDPSIKEAVEKHFIVKDHYYDRSTPIFIVRAKGQGFKEPIIKKGFKSLHEEISPLGYLPLLRWVVSEYYISILKKKEKKEENYRRNIYLFIATIGTVLLDGYLRSNNPILTKGLMKNTHPIFNAILFMFAIMIVFGLHELGHKTISFFRGVDSSMPYFIPAPPGMGGTLGAVITQGEPPVNRDALFDLGLSGPLTGFLTSTIIGALGLLMSFVVPQFQITSWMIDYPDIRFQVIPMPFMLEALANWLAPTPEGYALIMHPVAFAAWVGFIVTFINLIPAWQLDGGHIIRALAGKESHKIISIGGILLLIISGYVVMGVLVAFFMMRPGNESMTPLDDISSLSLSRKLGMLLYLLIGFLSLVALFPF